VTPVAATITAATVEAGESEAKAGLAGGERPQYLLADLEHFLANAVTGDKCDAIGFHGARSCRVGKAM